MQYYVHNIKKKDSFNLVVKSIKKISDKKLMNKEKLNIKFSLKDRLFDFRNNYFKPSSNFKKYSNQKIGNFTKNKINDILLNSDFFFEKRKKIKINQVGKKIFLMQ